MKVTIYHNPGCSKSRRALELLREHGVDPQIIAYLETPPDEGTLAGIVAALGVSPRALIREGEPDYAASGLADPALSDAQVLRRLSRNPLLLQRPIVVTDQSARIGRPPERVLEILPVSGD